MKRTSSLSVQLRPLSSLECLAVEKIGYNSWLQISCSTDKTLTGLARRLEYKWIDPKTGISICPRNTLSFYFDSDSDSYTHPVTHPTLTTTRNNSTEWSVASDGMRTLLSLNRQCGSPSVLKLLYSWNGRSAQLQNMLRVNGSRRDSRPSPVDTPFAEQLRALSNATSVPSIQPFNFELPSLPLNFLNTLTTQSTLSGINTDYSQLTEAGFSQFTPQQIYKLNQISQHELANERERNEMITANSASTNTPSSRFQAITVNEVNIPNEVIIPNPTAVFTRQLEQQKLRAVVAKLAATTDKSPSSITNTSTSTTTTNTGRCDYCVRLKLTARSRSKQCTCVYPISSGGGHRKTVPIKIGSTTTKNRSKKGKKISKSRTLSSPITTAMPVLTYQKSLSIIDDALPLDSIEVEQFQRHLQHIFDEKQTRSNDGCNQFIPSDMSQPQRHSLLPKSILQTQFNFGFASSDNIGAQRVRYPDDNRSQFSSIFASPAVQSHEFAPYGGGLFGGVSTTSTLPWNFRSNPTSPSKITPLSTTTTINSMISPDTHRDFSFANFHANPHSRGSDLYDTLATNSRHQIGAGIGMYYRSPAPIPDISSGVVSLDAMDHNIVPFTTLASSITTGNVVTKDIADVNSTTIEHVSDVALTLEEPHSARTLFSDIGPVATESKRSANLISSDNGDDHVSNDAKRACTGLQHILTPILIATETIAIPAVFALAEVKKSSEAIADPISKVDNIALQNPVPQMLKPTASNPVLDSAVVRSTMTPYEFQTPAGRASQSRVRRHSIIGNATSIDSSHTLTKAPFISHTTTILSNTNTSSPVFRHADVQYESDTLSCDSSYLFASPMPTPSRGHVSILTATDVTPCHIDDTPTSLTGTDKTVLPFGIMAQVVSEKLIGQVEGSLISDANAKQLRSIEDDDVDIETISQHHGDYMRSRDGASLQTEFQFSFLKPSE